MRRRRQIYGLILRPSEMNQDDYERTIFSSDYAVKSNFLKEYSEHLAAMQINALAAKIYIANNWQKITDYTGMEISIVDNSGKETYYYTYVKPVPKEHVKGTLRPTSKFGDEIDRMRQERHNPIITLSDVVLDPMDGDFSVTINGKDHNWIDDDSVIILADFIEQKLKEKEK